MSSIFTARNSASVWKTPSINTCAKVIAIAHHTHSPLLRSLNLGIDARIAWRSPSCRYSQSGD
ncbi:MAG: hypothetical protein HC838_09710 [Spirulinaceae cyanobacterium RM2_2_10]|nr:hypothetical protein [Spirulinaceae cyanobacterium RM2_2_10]